MPDDTSSVTGYGSQQRPRLFFDGDDSRYELFEVKFLSYLRLQNLLDAFESNAPDADKNARIFAELSMVLDDKSLSLIMRDAKKMMARKRWLYYGSTT